MLSIWTMSRRREKKRHHQVSIKKQTNIKQQLHSVWKEQCKEPAITYVGSPLCPGNEWHSTLWWAPINLQWMFTRETSHIKPHSQSLGTQRPRVLWSRTPLWMQVRGTLVFWPHPRSQNHAAGLTQSHLAPALQWACDLLQGWLEISQHVWEPQDNVDRATQSNLMCPITGYRTTLQVGC